MLVSAISTYYFYTRHLSSNLISSHLPFIWCKPHYPRIPSLVSCPTPGWVNEGGSHSNTYPKHFPTRAHNSIRVKQLSGSYLLHICFPRRTDPVSPGTVLACMTFLKLSFFSTIITLGCLWVNKMCGIRESGGCIFQQVWL